MRGKTSGLVPATTADVPGASRGTDVAGERPAVAVRLGPEQLAEVEELRAQHRTATGDPTSRSDVLRWVVGLGLAVARKRTAAKWPRALSAKPSGWPAATRRRTGQRSLALEA